jgi:chemotaxis protein methyltransferase CheR
MILSDFDLIKKIIYERAAITLESGKEYLIESRLLPLSREEGFPTLDAFMQSIREKPSPLLFDKIVDAMTTNETLFFRDVHPFEILRTIILPEFIEKRSAEKKLTIWCAASSSGQEAYSVAMIIKEHFPQLARWKLTFLASDISDAMLSRCRAGIYSQFEINRGLPLTYLAKYFNEISGMWHIDDSIKKMVELHKVNLAGQWPVLPKVDILLMRNVLIYFDVPTKQIMLKKARDILQKDGYLFLGGAETTLNLDDQYERVVMGRSTCYRQKQSNTDQEIG